MVIRPTDWSVVIAGRWNRAILTPAGIAKRLFNISESSQILVAVPLDGLSPYQVRHQGHDIVAMTDENRLIILATRNTYENMAHAMGAGVNALEALPETPVTAAGYNISFHSEESAPPLAALLAAPVDDVVAELGKSVEGRSITRSLAYEGGTLNITFAGDKTGFKLQCNFNKDSKDIKDLISWLKSPVAGAQQIVDQLVAKLGLQIEDAKYDDDGQ